MSTFRKRTLIFVTVLCMLFDSIGFAMPYQPTVQANSVSRQGAIEQPYSQSQTQSAPALVVTRTVITLTNDAIQPASANGYAGVPFVWFNNTNLPLILRSGDPQMIAVPLVMRSHSTNSDWGASKGSAGTGTNPPALPSNNRTPAQAGNIFSTTIAAGAVFTYTAAAPGEIPYFIANKPNLRGRLVVEPAPLPPDPGTVAPPLNGSIATGLAAATGFLYSGANPIQTGVAPGTINPQRVAILRGKVLSRQNTPISGTVISILNHPEYGKTLSRADGMFDMAVNGGSPLVINYSKNGLLPVQRTIEVPWQEYVPVPDVVMIGLDNQVTSISLQNNTTMQVAQSSVISDADGQRRTTLMFPAGMTATMVLSDGSQIPLSTMNVRATEYTAGPQGPAAMPGTLPPNSAYTFATEFSVDEVLAAGSDDVRFSQPVPFYVDNFLNFPVSTTVPTGYYDRKVGAWKASESGKVIKILTTVGGTATVDTDGDNLPDDQSKLDALGITSDELTRLATLYTDGKTLWRVRVTHFSSWDCNWPFSPPSNARFPNQPRPRPKPYEGKNCKKDGSIIECQSQTLGEALSLIGTPYSLTYWSNRQRGRTEAYTLDIPLSVDGALPGSLKRIDLFITVAGRTFSETFPANPNLVYTFNWDGKDAYGRIVQGKQPVKTQIHYVYDGVYERTQVFGQNGNGRIIGSRTRAEVMFPQITETLIGGYNAAAQGLGGWNIDVHHLYDYFGKTVYLGTGTSKGGTAYGFDTLQTAVGDSIGQPFVLDGMHARTPRLQAHYALTVAPDGTLYFIAYGRVWKVGADATIRLVAGTSIQGFSGDGGPATSAQLSNPLGLAIAPDGSLYIADAGNHRIRRVAPNGIITTIAGNGTAWQFGQPNGDGGPASAAILGDPRGLAVAADGTLYIGDNHVSALSKIRKIGPDGIITTIAGGNGLSHADNVPATTAEIDKPYQLAVDSAGNVYYGEKNISWRIRRIGTDGMITSVKAGGPDGGVPTSTMNGAPTTVAFGPEGALYFVESNSGAAKVRRIGTDGRLMTIVGGGPAHPQYNANGTLATQANLDAPFGLTIGPDGTVYFSEMGTLLIRSVTPSLPGFSVGTNIVASDDGSELYVFDADGRHLATWDAITRHTRYQFAYDAQGRLTGITDAFNRTLTIQHNTNQITFVAPGNRQTVATLDANGYLDTVTSPANQFIDLNHTATGLLTSLVDPRNNTYQFDYDSLGRLISDRDPAGGVSLLSRGDVGNAQVITFTTSLSRTTVYTTEVLLSGEIVRAEIDPAGARTEYRQQRGGTTITKYPDGTVVTATQGSDPRWGMQAPVLREMTVSMPNGLREVTTISRTIVLTDSRNPFTLRGMTETVTINGRTSTTYYDALARQTVRTSPEGRQTISTYNAHGELSTLIGGNGLDALQFTYDNNGNVLSAQQGNQGWAYGYDVHGRVISRTNAAGHQTQYTYNAAGNIISTTTPSGSTYQFTYDANGNRTAVIMPGGGVHTMTYTVINREATYTPPQNPSYLTQYNLARGVASLTLPGGRSVTNSYDSGGRITGMSYPEAGISFTYAGATDRVSSIVRTPVGSGTAQTITLGYSGSLVTRTVLSGLAAGQFNYTYNSNLNLTRTVLSSAGTVITTSLNYDRDNLLTVYGPYTITRNGPGGAASQISDGTGNIAISYDSKGRPLSRTHTSNNLTLYQVEYGYSASGLITRTIETLSGNTVTTEYIYDLDAQLKEVTRNGVTVERYTYDFNGNRLTRRLNSNPVETSTYDLQDRIMTRNGITYTFNTDGFMTARGNDTFVYSTRGELLQATVGGQTITYGYDGLGRRVSRTDNNGTIQYLYGNPGNSLQISAVRDTTGQLIYFYYNDDGILFSMEQGGTRYTIISDQVGTPRLMTNAAGQIVKLLDYDSFGNLISDSNPSLYLPFGYAGGLPDPVTGLTRFGYRDYDAAAGRWTARDPIRYAGKQANLYVYVGNNPISQRDPSGLFCIGGSLYVGYGGGVQTCITDEGASVCFEVGFGLGADAGVDNGGLEPDGSEVGIEAKAKCGPVGAGLNCKFDECGIDCTPKGELGPVTFEPGKGGLQPEIENGPEMLTRSGKCGVQGKLYGKICEQGRW